MQVLTAKAARRIIRYSKALPILKPRARALLAAQARKLLHDGYTPTTSELLVAVDWARVRKAIIALAFANLNEADARRFCAIIRARRAA